MCSKGQVDIQNVCYSDSVNEISERLDYFPEMIRLVAKFSEHSVANTGNTTLDETIKNDESMDSDFGLNMQTIALLKVKLLRFCIISARASFRCTPESPENRIWEDRPKIQQIPGSVAM